MQSIVVAVDFSNTSLHAIEYAIPIANRFKADLVLVWVDKFTTLESLYPDTSNENRNEAKKRFEEIVGTYGKKMAKGLTLDYKLRKGKVYHEIDHVAKHTGAILIVAGAHGISGYEEYWIGSNAFKIVTYATCPVITVRYDYVVRSKVDKILFPVDGTPETLQKLPFVVRMAKTFNSEVRVLATHSSNLKSIQRIAEKYLQQCCQYLETHKIEHLCDSFVSDNITKTLLGYAQQNKMDMITIMTEQENPANILLGPYAQQIINQSPVPILSIHPQENFCL